MENINKTLKKKKMVLANKFGFGSRLCEGNVLAPLTLGVFNGNHLVSFVNKC